jgi:hypothetical protein
MVALDIVGLRSVHGMSAADKRAIPGFGRPRKIPGRFRRDRPLAVCLVVFG